MMSSSSRRPGIAPDERETQVIRQIANSYLRGLGLLDICRELEQQGIPAPKGGSRWHPNVVRSILRNPLNAGLIRHDGKYIRGQHYEKRIHDESVYYQILDEMKKRKHYGPRTEACAEAPLARLIFCDESGGRLKIVHPNGPYRGYRCEDTRREGIPCASRPYIPAGFLEPRVDREIMKIAQDPHVLALAQAEAMSLLERLPRNHEEEAEGLRSELARIDSKKEEISRAFARDEVSLDTLTAYDRAVSDRKTFIASRLSELENTHVQLETLQARQARAIELLRDFPALWSGMLPKERRAVYEMLIEYIRVGRLDSMTLIKLKIRFVDEIRFTLPIHSQWARAREGIKKPPMGRRPLAYLALAADGYSSAQIASRWKVKVGTAKAHRAAAIRGTGAATLEEAIDKVKPHLPGWRHCLPLDGRCGKPKPETSILKPDEILVLKAMAAGRTDPEIAEELGVPLSTVSGRRARIREKLGVHCSEAAIAKATALGLLTPDDPSPSTLLRAYKIIASPVHSLRLKAVGLAPPTDRQMECLQALVDGLDGDEAARRMGIGVQAVVYLRMRIWRVVGGNSLRTALERVRELGILDWPGEGETA